jgi:predicted nucleic acid-binding protein
VLVLAKADGLIPAVRPRLEAIQAAGIYLGEQLVAEALRLAEEA